MTALCSGGASAAKPGFAAALTITPYALSGLLNNIPTPWAIVFAAAIGTIQFDLSTYCTTDPPSTPTLVAQDFIDLIQVGNWQAKFAADAKLIQWVKSLVWWDLCECTSVTTPARPTAPTAPTGLPQINPLPLTGPPGTPCFQLTATTASYTSLAGTAGTLKAVAGTWNAGAQTGTGFQFLTGVRQLVYTATGHTAGTHHPTMLFQSQFVDASGAFTGTLTGPTVAPGGTNTFTQTINNGSPPSFATLIPTFIPQSSPFISDDTFDISILGYCGSGVGQTQAPCCPPDPLLTGQLDQILNYVQLIQRQIVPFAYVASTVHSGLSGAGVLSVQGLLGAKVEITTLPSSLGTAGTSPTEHFDAGFITWGTADGYPQSVRLEHSPQLSLPARASAFTDLAYDLHPGVVVTITELLREP